MFLCYFAKAGQMVDHRFTDDVAIVFAVTKKRRNKEILKLISEGRRERSTADQLEGNS